MQDPDLKQIVYETILDLATDYKLNGLEKPRQLTILREPFSVENQILTPTMKVKRNVAKALFHKDINAMYEAPRMKANKR